MVSNKTPLQFEDLENTFKKIFERVMVCHRCQNFVMGHAGGIQLSHNIKKTSVDHADCEILGVERHGGVNIVN